MQLSIPNPRGGGLRSALAVPSPHDYRHCRVSSMSSCRRTTSSSISPTALSAIGEHITCIHRKYYPRSLQDTASYGDRPQILETLEECGAQCQAFHCLSNTPLVNYSEASLPTVVPSRDQRPETSDQILAHCRGHGEPRPSRSEPAPQVSAETPTGLPAPIPPQSGVFQSRSRQ